MTGNGRASCPVTSGEWRPAMRLDEAIRFAAHSTEMGGRSMQRWVVWSVATAGALVLLAACASTATLPSPQSASTDSASLDDPDEMIDSLGDLYLAARRLAQCEGSGVDATCPEQIDG